MLSLIAVKDICTLEASSQRLAISTEAITIQNLSLMKHSLSEPSTQ